MQSWQPAYSLNNITWVSLPGAFRFGGEPQSVERESISLQTDSGRRFVYNLFERGSYSLVFRINLLELATFQTLDEAVIGDTIPFYFSLIGDQSDTIQVRKEKDFRPVELENVDKAASLNVGYTVPLFDYTLQLTEELT